MLKLVRRPMLMARLTARPTALSWVLLAALVVRLSWALRAAGAGPLFLVSGDQYSYWYLGNSIADGDGYSLPSSDAPTAYYPVGFPLVLGALYWSTNHTPLPDGEVWVTTGYHVVIGTIAVWLVHLIAESLFDRRVALIAAWITALLPGLVFYVATFSVELTFIVLMLAALAIVVRHDWPTGVPPTTARLVAFGATLGAATLVRPFAVPMLLGVLLALRQAGIGWGSAVRRTGIAAGVVVLMAVPWAIRNAIEMDAFVPISTNLGDTLCMDRTEHANGTFRFAGDDGCADPAMDEVDRNRTNATRAWTFVTSHPLKEMELVGLRAFRMMEHDHSGLDEIEANGSHSFSDTTEGTVMRAIADWFFYGVGLLAVVAAVRDRRRLLAGPRNTLVLVTGLAIFLIPLGLWGNTRFHVPLLPFMAIGAAAWWRHDAVRDRRQNHAPEVAAG